MKKMKGFSQERTTVALLDRFGSTETLDKVTKAEVASRLWDRVEAMLKGRNEGH